MSTAFRYLIQARDKLYRSGLFRTRRLNHPVISVGNLTLGGTGKTPLVIALAQSGSERRDSGRSSSPADTNDRADGILVVGNSWKEAGDEPYLMARRLKDVPVVVCRRPLRGRRLRGKEQSRKHLYPRRRISAPAAASRRGYRDDRSGRVGGGERLLPTGRWREPKERDRAGARRVHSGYTRRRSCLVSPVPSFHRARPTSTACTGTARRFRSRRIRRTERCGLCRHCETGTLFCDAGIVGHQAGKDDPFPRSSSLLRNTRSKASMPKC